MPDELVDVYDENLNHVGNLRRSEAHASGAWHRSIHCWIVRPSEPGYVLFQKRGQDKDLFPNALDISAAGHYSAGEKPEDGVREILEELGIAVQFSELIPLGIKFDLAKIGGIINREFCDVYLLKRELAPEQYSLDPKEVEGIVQIKITDGLDLFGGIAKDALAQGVEWDKVTKKWRSVRFRASKSSFIPRIDSYYYKIFIMAERLLDGKHHLAI